MLVVPTFPLVFIIIICSKLAVASSSLGGEQPVFPTSTPSSRENFNDVEVIYYEDLVTGKDISQSIERAFGVNGLGLLTVANVPGLVEARYLNPAVALTCTVS